MSLFENILKAVKKDEPGIAPEGLALPGASDATFAPGAHDHLLLYLGLKRKADDREAALARVEAAVRACAAQTPSPIALLRELDQALDVRDAVNIVDDVVERVESLALEDWENVYDAVSAVALSTDRPQTLKVAIALLAPFQEPETVNFFAVLARHPEFSLYATTALANDPSPAARAELVALLDTATGWAKVDVIERLLRVEELELSEALITKGMENVEPLGHVVALGLAERCGLAEALDSRDTTRDTLVGACRILAQLAEDSASGARGGLEDYSGRDRAVAAFVSRLEGGPADLEMIEAAAAVRRWSARSASAAGKTRRPPPRPKTGRRGKPVPRAARALSAEEIAEETGAYLQRPDVVGVVITDVLAKQPLRRNRAARLAARAGISDALSPLLEVLTKHPDDDAVAAAAVALASGAELARLRDRLATRIAPETRTGSPEKIHALDANAKHTWQYLTLLEALPRLPDEASRALMRTATRDRDPAVRRAAFRALRTLPSLEGPDREALARAGGDPAPEIAEEAAND